MSLRSASTTTPIRADEGHSRDSTINPRCRPYERSLFGLAHRTAFTPDVIVHQPHRLHERIDGGRTDEGPATLLQVLGERGRRGRGGGNRELPVNVAFSLARFPAPDIASE